MLARALDEERKSQNDGTFTSVSFPLATCVFERGLCGAVNRDGSIAVPPQFDWVGSFHEGRALVRSGGLYGYVDSTGRLVVEPQFALAGDYWRGFAEVDVGGKSALIDLEGRRLLEPRFARAIPFNANVFWVKDGVRHPLNQNGADELSSFRGRILHTSIKAEGKWKLVDRLGNDLTTPEISSIRYFDPESDSLMWARTGAGWGLIKADGSWLVSPRYEQVGDLVDERAAVRIERKWGYIDRTGAMVVTPAFEQAGSFRGRGLAPVQLGGLWGYVDRAGAMRVQPKFDFAESFDRYGLAVARAGGLSGLLNESGAWVVEPKYHRILSNRKDFIWVVVDGKFGVFESSGRLIASPQFSQLGVVCGDGWVVGYADGQQRIVRDLGKPLGIALQGQLSGIDCGEAFRVQDGASFWLVDRSLRLITETRFEYAYPFAEHLAVVKSDGKFGYMKSDGTWLLPPKFDDARSFHDGLAIVRLGSKFGYVKADGAWLIQPSFDEAEAFEGGFAVVTLDGKRGIIDATGGWLGTTPLHRLDASLQRGLIAIKSDRRWGFVDASGAVVIEAKYDEVGGFERGVSWVKLNDAWCAIDRRGRALTSLPCQGVFRSPAVTIGPWPD